MKKVRERERRNNLGFDIDDCYNQLATIYAQEKEAGQVVREK